jgi:hypothetical protein
MRLVSGVRARFGEGESAFHFLSAVYGFCFELGCGPLVWGKGRKRKRKIR